MKSQSRAHKSSRSVGISVRNAQARAHDHQGNLAEVGIEATP